MISLCNDWEFTSQWHDGFMMGQGTGEPVRLPHSVRALPLHYADHNSYQMICGYRRKLDVTAEQMLEKRLFLQFDGAAHIATVYVNGREMAHHRCGYTAFRVEITDAVRLGENMVAVKLDTTENPEIPPFGFVIDYLTYGGLYREAWLDVRSESLISDLLQKFSCSPVEVCCVLYGNFLFHAAKIAFLLEYVLTVEKAVAGRLRDVLGTDVRKSCQVGDGAGQLYDPGACAGGKSHTVDYLL